jgi:hypothetical protein
MGTVWTALMGRCAWADVWGYVDEKGVSISRTERWTRATSCSSASAETFDTRRDPPPRRAVGVARAQPVGRRSHMRCCQPSFDGVFRQLAIFQVGAPDPADASSDHDIDFELLQALIAPSPASMPRAVSPKGAIGLMQLMPATARRYGVDSDRHGTLERKLTDPRTNIRTGTRYLRDLINMFPGELELALAAYNAGEGAVMRAGNRSRITRKPRTT